MAACSPAGPFVLQLRNSVNALRDDGIGAAIVANDGEIDVIDNNSKSADNGRPEASVWQTWEITFPQGDGLSANLGKG